jgi:hypothetical protein
VSGPSTTKRGRTFAGILDTTSDAKARATTEGGSKERHFYKPLREEFCRRGFQYRQIAREGNAAIYEQAWLGCAEPSLSYEVVRVRRREGFQIDGRFVEPAEVYPASELWGVDGFTFTDRNKAWDKFFEISLEEQLTEEGR